MIKCSKGPFYNDNILTWAWALGSVGHFSKRALSSRGFKQANGAQAGTQAGAQTQAGVLKMAWVSLSLKVTVIQQSASIFGKFLMCEKEKQALFCFGLCYFTWGIISNKTELLVGPTDTIFGSLFIN